ncbi:hypothetical protein [Clostridium sp.]|uniref:hypothetical protein n=1 Tax=Clostridium sp. TaxID=1506 RepID=UPI00262B335E|nr:hypothetical protein [Clostridium sp.]
MAEAKKKLEQQLKHAEFKDKQLMDAMKGSEAKAKECIVPASKDSIPLEGEDLKNRDDIPEYDPTHIYE